MKKTIVMLASLIAIGLCHAKTEYGRADSIGNLTQQFCSPGKTITGQHTERKMSGNSRFASGGLTLFLRNFCYI